MACRRSSVRARYRSSTLWVISSVLGRAPDLHSGGRRFEPDIDPLLYGGVAQLEERFVRTEEVTGSNPVTFHYGSVAKWI